MSSAVEEKMMSRRGLASVRGSSETMRMILLSFAALGITYELALEPVVGRADMLTFSRFTWGFEMTCPSPPPQTPSPLPPAQRT